MSSECSTPTQKDLKFFKSEVKWWVDKLNLRSWRFDVDIGDVDGDFAHAEIHYSSRLISITLGDYFPRQNRQRLLQETAFHEVFEAGCLGRLRIIAESREFLQDELDSECHAIVFRMQNLLLPMRRRG